MFLLACEMHNTSPPQMAVCPRVIVALPDVIECATIGEWLLANRFDPVKRPDARSATREMHAYDFDLLVTDSTLAVRDGLLNVSRQRNPSTAIIVIGNGADVGPGDAVSRHAMYLQRPLDRATLLCTVMMAIMEGRPARRSPRKIANRFEAVVNGVPAHIIDASHHGLRFQMPGRGLSGLPPQFNVRVPLIGVAVTVQRIWARSATGLATPAIWCGAALSANRPAVEQGWRGFVDMLPVVGPSAT
jgi:AmiR/NasT family two-component response regulator